MNIPQILSQLRNGTKELEELLAQDLIPAPVAHEFCCRCATHILQTEREAQREPNARLWERLQEKRAWLRGHISTEEYLQREQTEADVPEPFTEPGEQWLGELFQGFGQLLQGGSDNPPWNLLSRLTPPTVDFMLSHIAQRAVDSAVLSDPTVAAFQTIEARREYAMANAMLSQAKQFLRSPTSWLQRLFQSSPLESMLQMFQSHSEDAEEWLQRPRIEEQEKLTSEFIALLEELSLARASSLALLHRRTDALTKVVAHWSDRLETDLFDLDS